jgi:Protein of unknown function (DUF4239)
MSLWLSGLPIWASALIVAVIPTLASMGGLLLVRRIFGLARLITNNEVAGFKFAVVGVTYAVLLGFAVIVVWEKFRDAEAAVAQEASSVVVVHRLALGLSGDEGNGVRQHLIDYIQAVITDDWPSMRRGKLSLAAARALDGLYAAVIAVNPVVPREPLIIGDMLRQLDQITQARRERLLLATGIVPGVLWTVLYSGAVVTLGFTFFFGSESARAQALMTGMLGTVIFMALLVAVEIDHPFTGPVSVGTEALQAALDQFETAK